MYIIKKGLDDTIFTEDLTDRHLIVAKINEEACLLIKTKGYYIFEIVGSNRNLIDRTFSNTVSDLNDPAHPSIKSIVEKVLECGYKIAAFEMQDYKSALQWLIDN